MESDIILKLEFGFLIDWNSSIFVYFKGSFTRRNDNNHISMFVGQVVNTALRRDLFYATFTGI